MDNIHKDDGNDGKREELIHKAQNTKEDLDAKQNEALEAIASGEELERYETVSLGNLEIEVKGWLSGDTTDTVQKAQRLADSNDMDEIRESMETMLSALDDMTTSSDYGMQFWREYYRRYGPEGLAVAVETVLEPASEDMEAKKESLDGFREGTQGPRPSVGDGENGPDA